MIDAVRTVRVNGVDHAYEIRGRGDTVVLLHGGWLRIVNMERPDEYTRIVLDWLRAN